MPNMFSLPPMRYITESERGNDDDEPIVGPLWLTSQETSDGKVYHVFADTVGVMVLVDDKPRGIRQYRKYAPSADGLVGLRIAEQLDLTQVSDPKWLAAHGYELVRAAGRPT